MHSVGQPRAQILGSGPLEGHVGQKGKILGPGKLSNFFSPIAPSLSGMKNICIERVLKAE